VKFYGQDAPEHAPAQAKSTEQAIQDSLARHGHDAVLRKEK